MNTLLKPLYVREELLSKGVRIFTPHDFERIFHTSPFNTKYFLETQTDDGLFARLKQGIYTLKTDFPSEEEIANALYKPSYISFEYALAYYNMIPEMPYKITSATTHSPLAEQRRCHADGVKAGHLAVRIDLFEIGKAHF